MCSPLLITEWELVQGRWVFVWRKNGWGQGYGYLLPNHCEGQRFNRTAMELHLLANPCVIINLKASLSQNLIIQCRLFEINDLFRLTLPTLSMRILYLEIESPFSRACNIGPWKNVKKNHFKWKRNLKKYLKKIKRIHAEPWCGMICRIFVIDTPILFLKS